MGQNLGVSQRLGSLTKTRVSLLDKVIMRMTLGEIRV